MRDIGFPCTDIPSDAASARLLGLYPQRQEGLWMQRLKVPGGDLSATQWHTLAGLAQKFTPHTPLHLTTRQDVELHDLSAEVIPQVQQTLAAAGLTTVGACGDTLRNITVCPCSGASGVDLHPLARKLRQLLEAFPGIDTLPRKFKITLTCGPDCGQPYINDLGLVAVQRDGRWGLKAIGAGSLGAAPETGVELYDWLEPCDALPLALAALRFFAEYGDRTNRSRARLRHVRQRVGNEPFAKRLGDRLAAARSDRDWPEIELLPPAEPLDARLTLTFPNGDVTAAAAEALAELAGRDDVAVRIANSHRVMLFGHSRAELEQHVAVHAALRKSSLPQPAVVACPGTRWCSRGLVDTPAATRAIRAALADQPDAPIVCVSGCPNGCAHSRVAPIGLVGRLVRSGEDRLDAYDIYIGGEMGRTDKLSELSSPAVPAENVPAAIARLARELSHK